MIVVLTLLTSATVSYASSPFSKQIITFAGDGTEGIIAGSGQPEMKAGDMPEGLTADDWSTLQDLMREAQYQFTWQVSDGTWAYRAPSIAHDLSLSLATDGLHAIRYDAEGEPLWDFGLSLTTYGEQIFPAVIADGGLSGSRERVEYYWSREVLEWYVNSSDGIKHGLTLAAPPPGSDSATVELTFALRGALTAELNDNGRMLRLKDGSGETTLIYDQLAVTDAAGRSLPAYFSLSPGREGRGEGDTLRITIDTANAAYPLTVAPLLHSQATKLTASDTASGDYFGWSVAISGDTVVVGAALEAGAGGLRGAAYIFERNYDPITPATPIADNWGEVTKLTASDTEDGDRFGHWVAISGNTVAVAAPYEDGVGTDRGAAYIFERNYDPITPATPIADNWGEVTKLIASDTEDYDLFGYSVAISGDTVVVGALYEDGAGENSGAAYIYERNYDPITPATPIADNWGEVTKLTASDAEIGAIFGRSAAIDGDIVVVGAQGEDCLGIDQGAAYIFERNHGGIDNWGQTKKLTASDAQNDDFLGISVAISGDTVVVGANHEDGAGTDRGAAYIYERNQGGVDSWGEVQKLTAADAEDEDLFGFSVAISGDTVVVAAHKEDGGGSDRGAAYIFERNQGGVDNWGEVQKLIAADAADEDFFGWSVAISGDTVVVGAHMEDGAGDERGAAYLFVGNGRWQEVAVPRASDAQNSDLFGDSVAISGDTVVVGAPYEDGLGTDRGAAYVFTRNYDPITPASPIADNWGQVTKLAGSDAENYSYFGTSVAISGDTVVVGAHYEDGGGSDRGAAYIFERNYDPITPATPIADNWGEVTKLIASTPGNGERFGHSVAISGDTVVVGAYKVNGAGSNRGAAYVFARNQGGADSWGEVAELTASDAVDSDFFGYSVAISGDAVVVGASNKNGGGSKRGAAYVFARNYDPITPATPIADNWGEVSILTASDPGNDDFFGHSVAINGDTVVVGADGENGAGSNRGAAYVFERNQGGADSWGQVQKLIAADTQDSDAFGISVAISGDTVVVGAYKEDGVGNNRGAIYIFERNQDGADNWGEVTKLIASNAEDSDWFGNSVAVSGRTVVAGAPYESSAGTSRGAAYIYMLQPYKVHLPLVVKGH
jgi:hypothetical protein